MLTSAVEVRQAGVAEGLFGGGEFPALECMRLLRQSGYDGWFSLEWEKMWHPEIEDPEVALPLFPAKIRELAELADSLKD